VQEKIFWLTGKRIIHALKKLTLLLGNDKRQRRDATPENEHLCDFTHDNDHFFHKFFLWEDGLRKTRCQSMLAFS